MSTPARFQRFKKKAIKLIKGGRTGRRLYGGIYELSDARKVYIAFRSRKEIFRGGLKSLSEAVDEGVACWAVDYDTLLRMRREQILLIGIYVKDEGDIYVTHYDSFFDQTKCTVRNYSTRGGTLQKYLPIQHFAKLGKKTTS
jgi:hypothetical protein